MRCQHARPHPTLPPPHGLACGQRAVWRLRGLRSGRSAWTCAACLEAAVALVTEREMVSVEAA